MEFYCPKCGYANSNRSDVSCSMCGYVWDVSAYESLTGRKVVNGFPTYIPIKKTKKKGDK